jgi:colicin import membrane protein
MKRLLVALAIFCTAAFALAQEEEPQVKAERARITAERNQAETVYRSEEKACYGKFAVTDCVKAAKSKRRGVLADLHRQEVSLNDAQRKRQAAEHLRQLEERSSAKRQQERADNEAKALADRKAREARAAEKAANRSSNASSAPSNAAAREEKAQRKQAEASSSRTRRDEEAADNLRRFQQRQVDAKRHKADIEKRAAERTKPPASSLAVPP